jgi:Mn-dependent DtxR family transcriptional regulator
MNNQVGFVAGDIYHLLERLGEASLNDIKEELKQTPSMVQMGVGWLAREEKVQLSKKGAGYVVRLVR